MLVKTVATALEIHPFMLSTWRKDSGLAYLSSLAFERRVA